MEFITDFLLLAATGTACLYCWVLSRRLKSLTNAKSGFGAGIAALSQSAEEMKAAMERNKQSGDAAARRLESLLGQAEIKASHLQELHQQLTEMSASVAKEAEQIALRYARTLTPLIDEANMSADRLITALEKTPPAGLEPINDFDAGAREAGRFAVAVNM